MPSVRSNRRFLAAAVTAALLPAIVQAEPTNEGLLQKIEELSQKVLVLERKLEVRDQATNTTAGRRDGALDTTAWQVQASWLLTGEEESFRGFRPNNVFSLTNAARKATAYGLGLNWYLDENLKWVLNYDHTNSGGGAAGGADREDESAFLTRIAPGF